MAAPSITGTPIGAAFASSSTWTQSYTVSGTGSNRGLLVIVAVNQVNTDPTGVTFDGVALSLIAGFDGLGIQGTTFWFLANPTTTTADIVVSLTDARIGQIHIMDLQDVASTSPVDASGQAGDGSASSQTKQITTTVADTLVISSMAVGAGAITSFADSQTTILSTATTGTIVSLRSSQSTQAVAGNVTHSYSWTTARANDECVISLKPYVAPTNTNFLIMM